MVLLVERLPQWFVKRYNEQLQSISANTRSIVNYLIDVLFDYYNDENGNGKLPQVLSLYMK